MKNNTHLPKHLTAEEIAFVKRMNEKIIPLMVEMDSDPRKMIPHEFNKLWLKTEALIKLSPPEGMSEEEFKGFKDFHMYHMYLHEMVQFALENYPLKTPRRYKENSTSVWHAIQ